MKPIILCADDYGATPPIGVAIRTLVAQGRLSAVSCLSDAPLWPAEAALLRPLRSGIDVGLHFNLTLGLATPKKDLGGWLKNCLSGAVDRQSVTTEFENQLDRFESIWGGAPDFIDGHQHVHVFPVIRNCIFSALSKRYRPTGMPWLRRVNPSLRGHDALLKALVVRLVSLGFSKMAQRAGARLSGQFAGLYSLSGQADFPTMMAGWLRRAQAGDLLMCHPGSEVSGDPDGIGAARLNEFTYLSSADFQHLCAHEKITLARFKNDHPSPLA